mmetsp:Transcript_20795/g.52392  ORF Transcript_20795/g.52392 Transcript_20795/m.52392 type:complete len:239 (-) Transcript_20795:422-1138(-)
MARILSRWLHKDAAPWPFDTKFAEPFGSEAFTLHRHDALMLYVQVYAELALPTWPRNPASSHETPIAAEALKKLWSDAAISGIALERNLARTFSSGGRPGVPGNRPPLHPVSAHSQWPNGAPMTSFMHVLEVFKSERSLDEHAELRSMSGPPMKEITGGRRSWEVWTSLSAGSTGGSVYVPGDSSRSPATSSDLFASEDSATIASMEAPPPKECPASTTRPDKQVLVASLPTVKCSAR